MNIVVTDYVERDLEWEAEQYTNAGFSFRALQMRAADASALLGEIGDADVLVVDQARITREVIAGLPRCKIIIRHGDGYDNVDVAAATEAGVVCANKPGFWSVEVAEQAVALSMALVLMLPHQIEVARSPRPGGTGWNLHLAMPQHRIGSMTVGIVGYGKIGRHAARIFGGLCDSVVVADPIVDPEVIRGDGHIPASLAELLQRADLVSLHVPATEETIGMIDAATLEQMRRDAFLVNTSRGTIVDTEALVEALNRGRIAGAGLDAVHPEPLPPDHPLLTMEQVIVTPHLGWYTEESLASMRESIVADVVGIAAGRVPESVVNPEVLTRWNCRISAEA